MSSPGHWIAFGVLWAVAILLVVVVRYPEVLSGTQLDADGYMRLVRVEELMEGWAWFDNGLARSDWPFGDTLHWTRPLDLLIVGLALPLIPALGTSTAVLVAGTSISPLLHLASCLALIWVVAPFISSRTRAFAAPALLVQPVVLSYGLPGRADHHGLVVLLFVLALGAAVRWILDPARERAALATGFLCALGLWISPEFLAPLAFFFAAGTLAWILNGPRAVLANIALTAALALGLVGVLALERPPSEWATVEYDRVSVAHWTMSLLALGFWLAVAAGRSIGSGVLRIGLVERTGIAVGGGVAAAALLHLVHPEFLAGPWVSTDPEVRALWLQNVRELQPLWPRDREDVGAAVIALGIAPFAVFALARRAWSASARSERLFQAWLCGSTAAFVAMAMAQARWGVYAGVFLAIGALTLLDPGLELVARRFRGMPLRAARLALIVSLIVGPFIGGALVGAAMEPNESPAGSAGAASAADADAGTAGAGTAGEAARCRLSAVAAALSDPAIAGGRRVTVLAHLDRGPEILYRTPHRVLAGPYHRNRAGILDIHAAFTRAPDDPRVHEILAEREIALVLLCPTEDRSFLGTGPDGSTFYRLVDGPTPAWAREVEVPAIAAEGFRLFRVE